MSDQLIIKGAKQHNLQNVNLILPKNKLIVFTGLSGSGKSSLAFDTIYAEGQRRYVESLSSYARQFLGLMTKPDVEQIIGLSPAIAIDQKTTSHNPRSTVGTITEIYDYLRLLYARIGHPHCPNCGREITTQTIDQIVNQSLSTIVDASSNQQVVRFMVLAPLVRDKKGEFSDLLTNLKKQGIQRVRIDNNIFNLDEEILLIKTNRHTIEAVLERFSFSKAQSRDEKELKTLRTRLTQSLEAALKIAQGLVLLTQVSDASLNFPEKPKQFTDHLFSENFACSHCNLSLPEIEPRIFSFNSPHGACPTCTGLGHILKIDREKILAPNLTLFEGAIIPLAHQLSTDTWMTRTLKEVFSAENIDPAIPWNKLPADFQSLLFFGSNKTYHVSGENKQGKLTAINTNFEGFIPLLERRYSQTDSDYIRNEIGKFMSHEICSDCKGSRLKPESLSVSINKLNIIELTNLSISQTHQFILKLQDQDFLNAKEKQIGKMILKELASRLQFLLSVGLEYLTLSREAATLAGGEAQRIRLASQIGTGLSGVLYVLDEPSIGLHQRDNHRLIDTLKNLKNLGNTIIVVEHDADIMLASDHLVDFGPKAGKLGGHVIFSGTPKEILTDKNSLTGKYLSGKMKVNIPSQNFSRLPERYLTLTGCNQNNLQNLTVDFPLNQLVVLTGVSGSGKSSLLHDTLYHAVKQHLNPYYQDKKNNFTDIKGLEYIDRVSLIDQSPIGRTPRSNPATYTKLFDHIRKLFAETKEAKVSGFNQGRFSFNVKGGRCEACSGDGQVKIEMQFMPDVYITCDVCHGKRYQEQTLEITFRGKNISDVLSMSVDDAIKFFPNFASLTSKLSTLQEVGLGYLELGQPAPTLSGGEAQRVKLAKELSVKSSGHTLYLLDEPTTGLHFEDLKKLLVVLKALVAQNNSVVLIEHNLDIIKNADWIIDLGPEGGSGGGQIVAFGTPQQIANNKASFTGSFLKKVL